MTKLENYTAKAAESLAAIETSTSARERAFHNRAYAIWRRLIAGVADEEKEREMHVAEQTKPAKGSPK